MSPALSHHRGGTGEPLLLVHGVGHHWQGWAPVLGALEREFDVIAPDSPGFGRSAPLPAGVPPTIASYADALEAFLAGLGVERPHVAGNSMGGAIAIELLRRGSVRTATAISPAGFWSPRERTYAQSVFRAIAAIPAPLRPAVVRSARTRTGRAALTATLVARPARMSADEAASAMDDLLRAPALLPCVAAFDGLDLRSGAGLRTDGLTVAWGTRDRLLLARPQARRAREALPAARHVALAGLGHVPMSDDPGVVAEVIRQGALG